MFSSNIKIFFSSLVLSSVIYSCSKKEEPSPSAATETSQVMLINEVVSDVTFQLNDKKLPDTFPYRGAAPYREMQFFSSGENTLKAFYRVDQKLAYTQQSIKLAKAANQSLFIWQNPVEAVGDPVTFGYLAIPDTLTAPSNGKAKFRFAVMRHNKTKNTTFDLRLNGDWGSTDTTRILTDFKIGQVSHFIEVNPSYYSPTAYVHNSIVPENSINRDNATFEAGKIYTLVLSTSYWGDPYMRVIKHN